jgi:hypothetical protein
MWTPSVRVEAIIEVSMAAPVALAQKRRGQSAACAAPFAASQIRATRAWI